MKPETLTEPHLRRNSTRKTQSIMRIDMKEIVESNVRPCEFHIQGFISNESKQKWREEIFTTR